MSKADHPLPPFGERRLQYCVGDVHIFYRHDSTALLVMLHRKRLMHEFFVFESYSVSESRRCAI